MQRFFSKKIRRIFATLTVGAGLLLGSFGLAFAATTIGASITLDAGGALRTNTTATDTLLLQARDVDGASYTTFATLTANNTPTMDLSTAVTIGGIAIVDFSSAQTLTAKTLTTATLGTSLVLDQTTADYTITWADPGGARALTIADPGGADTFAYLAATQTFTNKTLTDDTTLLQDNTDNTKKLAFQLSGITTSTTRTVTVPDANGTLTLLGNAATGSGSVVLATSPSLVTPALGTPASGIMTNVTGTASGLTAGNVTTNANLTGPITSVGNATSIAAQTGTGTTFVVQTSPSLTTPNIGVASATSLATSAASPLLLTNGQLVTVALTSQTVGGTILTIPDFASVADEFTFKTLAQTMSNKTLTAPRIGTSILDTNGNELFLLTATASAVNELTLANATAGNGPTISATGTSTDINIELAPKGTGTVNIDAADNLTVAGIIVPQHIEVSYCDDANGDLADQAFFIANRAYEVTNIQQVHSVAGGDGGAVNLQVSKLTGTTAVGGGTDVLTNNTNAGFDLKGTANTVQTGTLTTTTLAAGDRLEVDYAGTLTSLAGVCVTVTLKRI